MRILRKENGFTLIEMLLVLMIVVVISTSAVHFTVKSIEQHRTEQFFRQFQTDMHFLQSYAMANEQGVSMFFSKKGTFYQGELSGGEVILYKKMPEDFWSDINNGYRLRYLPNGNVSKFGVLTIHTPEGWRKLNIYIGKGRMVLDERIWSELS